MARVADAQPAVTIVVPVYNAETTLSRCVQSLLDQTFSDFEAILVENNSNDGSLALAQRWAAQDARIRVVRQTRQGVSAARNMGIDEARGEYVLFVDSDDAIAPCTLAETLHEAKQTDGDIVFLGVEMVFVTDDGGTKSRGFREKETVRGKGAAQIARIFADGLYRYGLFSIFACYRRTCFAPDVRFDERMSLGEDVALNLRIMRGAKAIAVMGTPQYQYYFHFAGNTLNTKFRPDMIEIKVALADIVQAYLRDCGVWDERAQKSFYCMYAQDAFVCASNLMRDPSGSRKAQKAAFEKLLAVPYTQTLIRRRRTLPLTIGQRLFVQALAMGSFGLTRLSVRVYDRINR